LILIIIGIDGEEVQDNATIMHALGAIVWHNVPKLRDVVVIDPQWLADTMAGVVSFICQVPLAKAIGMTSWHKIQESLKLKYAPPLSLLQ
jgi:hypothetical protein